MRETTRRRIEFLEHRSGLHDTQFEQLEKRISNLENYVCGTNIMPPYRSYLDGCLEYRVKSVECAVERIIGEQRPKCPKCKQTLEPPPNVADPMGPKRRQ